jgi:hypothetical protein
MQQHTSVSKFSHELNTKKHKILSDGKETKIHDSSKHKKEKTRSKTW